MLPRSPPDVIRPVHRVVPPSCQRVCLTVDPGVHIILFVSQESRDPAGSKNKRCQDGHFRVFELQWSGVFPDWKVAPNSLGLSQLQ